MTLPNYVKLAHLDRGVKDLVVNLNRVPGVYTQTTCEGHVWRQVPAWPTKDGWVHFQKPAVQHDGLVDMLTDYCSNNKIFTLDEHMKWEFEKDLDKYTLNGWFESHQGDDGLKPFSNMTPKEQKEYWSRADLRKKELLKGWRDINLLVVKYISENLCEDYLRLPYRNPEDKTDFRVFGHC